MRELFWQTKSYNLPDVIGSKSEPRFFTPIIPSEITKPTSPYEEFVGIKYLDPSGCPITSFSTVDAQGFAIANIAWYKTDLTGLTEDLSGDAWDFKVKIVQQKYAGTYQAQYVWLASQYHLIASGMQDYSPTIVTDMSKTGWTKRQIPKVQEFFGSTIPWVDNEQNPSMWLMYF